MKEQQCSALLLFDAAIYATKLGACPLCINMTAHTETHTYTLSKNKPQWRTLNANRKEYNEMIQIKQGQTEG